MTDDADPSSEAVARWLAELTRSLADRSFVKLTLAKPVRSKGTAEPPSRSVSIRLVEIKREPHLSVLTRVGSKDVTTNHPVATAADVVGGLLMTSFQNGHLFTTGADIELRANKKGVRRLYTHKATFHEPPDLAHDRPKRYVLDPAKAPYLQALGVVRPDGKVAGDKADKYRQLQNIIKLLDGFVDRSTLRQKERLRVVDMGCGKGYLTFALYDYCNHHLGIETEVIGVDRTEELVSLCNGVAQKVGYERLRFVCSDVETFDLPQADIFVALHACDTATDVALFKGVAAGASIVMVVPCCQKELRPQFKAPASEQALFKHDTFKDRYSQMLTDALRGLLLESQGYHTRVIEFISDAHTHRNVMIVGVHDRAFRQAEQRLAEVKALKERYGVANQRLETLLLEGGRLATTSGATAAVQEAESDVS